MMNMKQGKQDIISKLKQDILCWEGFQPPQPNEFKSFGLGPIDKSFPNSIFPTGAIHEFISHCPEDTAACGGFISGIVKNLLQDGGACVWVSWSRRIYPPALKLFGVDPDRVIFVDVPNQKDVLWVTEEALRCEGIAAVICEANELSFAQSQRLQLAVEKSKVTGFILRKDVKQLSTTACISRWRIISVPSELRKGMPGVGLPRWQVDLLKIRNGNPGTWIVEWANSKFNTITLPPITELRQYA
jgi:protein ImuA